jgi:Family of unknown function (DUF6527)
MRQTTFTPEFVEYIPRQLDNGVLYVSIQYCTAVHKCACGCGNKVVTPISPADWQILFDGEGMSLFPSVGNWSFPCRAHYWIRSNRVVWDKAWSPDQIARGRARERRSRAEYFGRRSGQVLEELAHSAPAAPPTRRRRFARISHWWRQRFGGVDPPTETGGL